MKKTVLFLLAAVLVCLSGCQVIGDIAGNVVEAASTELKNQVQTVLQEYKVEVVELKTATGKLNEENDAKLQFFCAVLLKTNSQDSLNACISALDALFPEVGSMEQTDSPVISDHLVKKTLRYDFTGFADGGPYYTVYAYVPDISIQLPDLDSMIPTGTTQS